MKTKNKEARPYELCLKSTGQPSARVPARRTLTEAQAAALDEDVLKYSAFEWREVEEGRGWREALRRSAK
jgi:hypothetical protein